MSAPDLSVYDSDPTLYLVTSLTAGSSHIISATSRMETILRANKIPFVGVDTATDDRMRSLWGRRARGKKFPGLVREGFLLGDLEQVEEWNEFGELHENIPTIGKAPVAPETAPKAAPAEPPVSIPTNAKQKVENKPPAPAVSGPPQTLAMRQMVQEAAAKAKDFKAGKDKDKEDKGPVTPIKLGRIDHSKPKLPPSDLRSPKSIPIPDSPALKSPVSPVTESGVVMSIDERAAKPKTHRGSSVSVASQEDIKKIENEQKIDEEDEEDSEDDDEEEESSEEDDDDDAKPEDVKYKHTKKTIDAKKVEDEDEDDDEEDGGDGDDDDEDDEDEEEDSSEEEASQPSKPTTTTTTSKPLSSTPASPTATTKATAATTSNQPAASAAHAGQSVGD